MLKRTKLLLISLLLLMYGCSEDKSPIEKPIPPEVNNKITQPTLPKTPHDLLKDMGFDFNGEKVNIDINKTTNFFKRIEIEMHSKAEEIEEKIENADINFTQGIGIDIRENSIGIDLNKTRNVLQQLNSLVKDIVLDINHTTN